jgi:dihydroxyacetone kinase
MGNAKEIIEQVMERLINSKRLNLTNDRTIPIVVLLNNLGSTSQLELRIIQGEILTWLSEFLIKIT